jgi:glycolate oxidase
MYIKFILIVNITLILLEEKLIFNNIFGKKVICMTKSRYGGHKISTVSDEILEKLIKITGEDRVRNDYFERRMYSHDLASLPKVMEVAFKMMPDYVVRPKSGKEIAEIMKLASKNKMPVVPRGGASWGLGGVVPIGGGIVLDLTGMNKVLSLDEDNLTVTVEAGISWKYLYDFLLTKGFLLGSYPSSALAATVGGWINTGGVGIGSYKYGSAKEHVISLEIILPSGKIIGNGPKRSGTRSHHDPAKLFFGAEGTLGIITKATMRIYPAPKEIRPLSYSFTNMKKMSNAIAKITRSDITPLHMGFLDGNHFDFLREIKKPDHVPDVGAMLNIALDGDPAILDLEEKTIDRLVKDAGGVKQNKRTAKHEWEERFYELRTKRAGPTATLGEVFIPVSSLDGMANDTNALIKKMKLRGAITGMVCDNNSILFMPYYLSDERKLVRNMLSLSFVKKLGDIATKNNGRPAGLGLFFSGNLKKMHGNGVFVMDEIKGALDPADVMNPGKTTEGLTRFGVPLPPLAVNMSMNVMFYMKRALTKDKGGG